jgi:hypothetical protein
LSKRLTNTKTYRRYNRMKVTALIPDDLIIEVKQYAGGKNLTESLIAALKEWVSLRKIKDLNRQVKKKPLQFVDDFSADTVRSINRNQ